MSLGVGVVREGGGGCVAHLILSVSLKTNKNPEIQSSKHQCRLCFWMGLFSPNQSPALPPNFPFQSRKH